MKIQNSIDTVPQLQERESSSLLTVGAKMAHSFNQLLFSIDDTSRNKHSYEKNALVLAAQKCLKDRTKVIVKKAFNWYSLKPSGHYALYAPEDSVAYLELDSSRKEVVEFSSEHAVMFTNLIVGKEEFATVVKFQLVDGNKSNSVTLNYLSKEKCKEALKNYQQLHDYVQRFGGSQICVNAACVLEISSFGWLLGKRMFVWVERRLSNFQKFLSKPLNYDPTNARMHEKLLTSCSDKYLQELQEFIYKESDKKFTVCDIQGCITTKVSHAHVPLFSTMVDGAKGGYKLAGPLGGLVGGFFGFLLGAITSAEPKVKKYYILADVEFTNTLQKFGFNEQNLLTAYEENVTEQKVLREAELRREEQEKKAREKALLIEKQKKKLTEVQKQVKTKHDENEQKKLGVCLCIVMLIFSIVECLTDTGGLLAVVSKLVLWFAPIVGFLYARSHGSRDQGLLLFVLIVWEVFLLMGLAFLLRLIMFILVVVLLIIAGVFLWNKGF